MEMLDMRDKVKEYITELEAEIKRCDKELHNVDDCDEIYIALKSRAIALSKVKNDLINRLEESV
jgi:hypothetical protein